MSVCGKSVTQCVCRREGLWVIGFWMRWLCCNIPPHGTVILACVFVCVIESKLATVACLSWLTLTTWSYLHHAHSAPLDTHMHTHISVFVSLSFVCVCVCSHVLILFALDHSFSLPRVAQYLFSVFVSVCAFRLVCLSSVSLFSEGEAVFDWKQVAGRDECMCVSVYT